MPCTAVTSREPARRAPRVLALLAIACAFLAPPAARAAEPAVAKPVDQIAIPAPKDLAAAVEAIERATGAKADRIAAGSAKIPLPEGRSFALDGKTAERLLAGSHGAFRQAGLYLFRYERSFGLAGEKDRVAVLAAPDFAAVIRRIGTGSAKRGVTCEQIVAWLEALAKEEPFDVLEIGVDFVAGRFARAPKDPAAIARRSAEIAPDLVSGRASTLALLAEEIRANRTLYLIWD